jgi:hypothetical protein
MMRIRIYNFVSYTGVEYLYITWVIFRWFDRVSGRGVAEVMLDLCVQHPLGKKAKLFIFNSFH